MDELHDSLHVATQLLAPGAPLAILTFHSGICFCFCFFFFSKTKKTKKKKKPISISNSDYLFQNQKGEHLIVKNYLMAWSGKERARFRAKRAASLRQEMPNVDGKTKWSNVYY